MKFDNHLDLQDTKCLNTATDAELGWLELYDRLRNINGNFKQLTIEEFYWLAEGCKDKKTSADRVLAK